MSKWSQILDDIIEVDDELTIITGYLDIIDDEVILDKSRSYKIIGKLGIEDIDVELFNVDVLIKNGIRDYPKDSEFRFWIIIKYNPGEYGEFGLISPGYINNEYLRLDFQQTIKQRERDIKLDSLINLSDIFK